MFVSATVRRQKMLYLRFRRTSFAKICAPALLTRHPCLQSRPWTVQRGSSLKQAAAKGSSLLGFSLVCTKGLRTCQVFSRALTVCRQVSGSFRDLRMPPLTLLHVLLTATSARATTPRPHTGFGLIALRLTTSQPLSLLSMAKVKHCESPIRPST